MKRNNFDHPIDELVYQAVFGENLEKKNARFSIWQQANAQGIIPASIHDFYLAKATGEVSANLTVPAFNIRGIAYDTARASFQAAKEKQVGALIFEIARSEMIYTDQRPEEYTVVLMAAALREGWSGPLFVQGDHFQAKAEQAGIPNEGEIENIKNLIKEAITAGFYNIDIDMSTLVDLGKANEAEQQQSNVKYSLEMINFIRDLEPDAVTISIGGEIGHIGGKNSTVADFRAYMDGLSSGLNPDVVGISKVSVQTGTSHGGVMLGDGSLADVDVDFSVLRDISQVARDEYQIGGAVQHGASTISEELFDDFSQTGTVEIHLATGLQNLIFDHPAFPEELLAEMYAWLDKNKQDERKQTDNDEQFHYKLRKKAWKPFKQAAWGIEEKNKSQLREALKERFIFFFEQFNVNGSADLINKIIKPIRVEKPIEEFCQEEIDLGRSRGLSD